MNNMSSGAFSNSWFQCYVFCFDLWSVSLWSVLQTRRWWSRYFRTCAQKIVWGISHHYVTDAREMQPSATTTESGYKRAVLPTRCSTPLIHRAVGFLFRVISPQMRCNSGWNAGRKLKEVLKSDGKLCRAPLRSCHGDELVFPSLSRCPVSYH